VICNVAEDSAPTAAPADAPDNLTYAVSVPSAYESSLRSTVNVFCVSPAAKLRTPAARV
jgi:hypothetical protein